MCVLKGAIEIKLLLLLLLLLETSFLLVYGADALCCLKIAVHHQCARPQLILPPTCLWAYRAAQVHLLFTQLRRWERKWQLHWSETSNYTCTQPCATLYQAQDRALVWSCPTSLYCISGHMIVWFYMVRIPVQVAVFDWSITQSSWFHAL